MFVGDGTPVTSDVCVNRLSTWSAGDGAFPASKPSLLSLVCLSPGDLCVALRVTVKNAAASAWAPRHVSRDGKASPSVCIPHEQ